MAGFVNNHMYLTNYFEQILQMVEPRTALHYMDYTKYFGTEVFEQRKL
jgi:hypothetical protein